MKTPASQHRHHTVAPFLTAAALLTAACSGPPPAPVPAKTPAARADTALRDMGIPVWSGNYRKWTSKDGIVAAYLGNDKVNDAVWPLLEASPNLQSLRIIREAKLTDEGMKRLANLTNLRQLTLPFGRSINGEFFAVVEKMPDLEELEAWRTSTTDADLVHLKGLAKLEYLGLQGTEVTDRGVAVLVGLKSLHTLNLSHTQITDASVPDLLTFPHVESLDITATHLSPAAVQKLRDKFPASKITAERMYPPLTLTSSAPS